MPSIDMVRDKEKEWQHLDVNKQWQQIKKQEGQHPLTGQRAANFRLF